MQEPARRSAQYGERVREGLGGLGGRQVCRSYERTHRHTYVCTHERANWFFSRGNVYNIYLHACSQAPFGQHSLSRRARARAISRLAYLSFSWFDSPRAVHIYSLYTGDSSVSSQVWFSGLLGIVIVRWDESGVGCQWLWNSETRGIL